MIDVSIVIPVYNAEKYLDACIESILQQTGVSTEIFLVDDGSSDASPTICDRYAEKYDNITTIHQVNSGQSVARNTGLKRACGRYVTFTDNDDKMLPSMLNKMVAAADKHNADIVCCNYQEIDEYGIISRTEESTNKEYVLDHEEALIHFYSKNKIFSQCWSKLYRRQMLADNHIENEPVRYDEDLIFNIKAFKAACTTVIVDEPLFLYTNRTDSVVHSHWRYKKYMDRYIDDNIRRLKLTAASTRTESEQVKKWAMVHMLMYYNQLIGRVAAFPEYYSDKRIKDCIRFIRKNRATLNEYYTKCGFSKLGKMLVLFLPSGLYMRYRKTKL
ncbi:MAG: glycosyltransferase [Prevotella sp.]|nr:glycosyltransferase [Prevotella sp.]